MDFDRVTVDKDHFSADSVVIQTGNSHSGLKFLDSSTTFLTVKESE